ncbi:hypothetical protein D3C72_1566620 [compost metagenome]
MSVSQDRCSISASCGRRRTPTRLAARIIGHNAIWKGRAVTMSCTMGMPIMRNIAPAAHSSRHTASVRLPAIPRCTALRHAAR